MQRFLAILFLISILACSTNRDFKEISSTEFDLKILGEFTEEDWLQIDNVKFIHMPYQIPFEEIAFEDLHSFDGQIHTIKLPVSRQKVTIADGIERTSIYRDTDFLTFYIRFLNVVNFAPNLASESTDNQSITYRFEAGATLHLQKRLHFWREDKRTISVQYSSDYPISLGVK
ncbi:hypothetical protein [Peijinzhouia sedimentorum]